MKKYKIIVLDEAQIDTELIVDFYVEHVSKKVAKAFLKDLISTYNTLKLNPFYQFRNQKYRAIPLKKFPYIIFFDLNEVNFEIKIVAIFNTHQDSSKHP